MTALWDTTGGEVVRALAAERRSAGGVTSGLALTLVVVVDERREREAEEAATLAAAQHPCRLIIVVRRDVLNPESRLDAEIVVGGRLGPCEAVIMRMYGRLALHAESVVLPLLAPDVPVVTWWHGVPPTQIAHDPLGVVAGRRITDSARAPEPVTALAERAADYAPGDTDLAWTRATPWRALLAGAFDGLAGRPTAARLVAAPGDPVARLLAGWLQSRLGVRPVIEGGERLTAVEITLDNGCTTSLVRQNGTATLHHSDYEDRILPLIDRAAGEELAEELRRLDPDEVYAAALGAATSVTGLNDRPATRVHIWQDPAVAEKPEPAVTGSAP